MADSLMFTGFSVPLLDYLVKTVLMDRQFGITVSSSPILLYAVMGAVNGGYLATHNMFRGFPCQSHPETSSARFSRSQLPGPSTSS